MNQTRQQLFQSLLLFRFISAFATYGLLIAFAILMASPPYDFAGVHIATLITTYALADQGLAWVWSPILPKIRWRTAMLVGSGLTMSMLYALSMSRSLSLCMVILFLFGLGRSLEQLTLRLWVTDAFEDLHERHRAFSTLHRVLNGATAFSPILIFLLPYRTHAPQIIVGMALCCSLALMVLLTQFRDTTKPQHVGISVRQAWPTFVRCRTSLRAILGAYGMFTCCLFMCFQVNIFPYYFHRTGSVPQLLGAVLAMASLLVVCFQKQTSKYTQRFFPTFGQSSLAALTCYVLGLLPLIWSPSLLTLAMYIVLITLGEMIVFPQIDVALGRLTPKPLQSYAFAVTGMLYALASTVAEGGGIAAIDLLAQHGMPLQYWWAAQAMLIGAIIVTTVVKTVLWQYRDEVHTSANAALCK